VVPKGPSKTRFEQIFSQGQRFRGEVCSIIFLPGTGLVGIGTSRKIGGKPRRNFVKRRIRAAVVESQLNLKSIDCVFMVGTRGVSEPYELLSRDVQVALQKALAAHGS
jgi:ribonuclease P protein component